MCTFYDFKTLSQKSNIVATLTKLYVSQYTSTMFKYKTKVLKLKIEKKICVTQKKSLTCVASVQGVGERMSTVIEGNNISATKTSLYGLIKIAILCLSLCIYIFVLIYISLSALQCHYFVVNPMKVYCRIQPFSCSNTYQMYTN